MVVEALKRYIRRGEVPPECRDTLLRDSIRHNFMWLSAVLGAFFLWLSVQISVDSGQVVSASVRDPRVLWFLWAHSLFLLLSGLILGVSVFVWPRSISSVTVLHRVMVTVSGYALLLWAAVVSGVEATLNGSASTYHLCVVIVACLAVVRLWWILLAYLGSAVVFLGVMEQFGVEWQDYLSSHPSFVGFLLFALIASRLFCRNRVCGLMDRYQLLEEISLRRDAEESLLESNRQLEEHASRVDDDLRLSESRFRSLVKNSPDLILTVNGSGEVLFTSRPVPGVDEEDVRGAQIQDLLPGTYRNAFTEGLEHARGGETLTIEHDALDGTHWLTRLVPLSRVHGSDEFMLISQDVTDRRETERRERELTERLQHAERMESLGLLAGGVAHDLNNILGPIVALPSLIREDLQALLPKDSADGDRLLGDLDVLENSAMKATDVIRDLLTLGRRHNYEKEILDLNQIVRETLAGSGPTAAALNRSKARIETDLSDDPLTLLASSCHLGRALANVVRNAAEAMEEGGLLRVRTRRERIDEAAISFDDVIPPGDYVLLEVQDAGPGINYEDLPRIFEPFFSSKNQTGHSGTGLGLAIVHGVVKDHNGFVDVKSAHGRGTTFLFYFPHVAGEVDTDSGGDSSMKVGTEKILVVDDDLTQRLLAERALRRLGYQVSLVGSGQEAVDLFRTKVKADAACPYDLVLLDMIMDGFDGLSTMRELRDICPEVKVIIASGYSASERARTAAGLGAGWLSKPYELKGLANVLREKLDEPQV